MYTTGWKQSNSNIRLLEHPSSGSRVAPCGRTNVCADTTQLIVPFRNFANAPKNWCYC